MMMMISASSSQHFACIQRRLAAVVQCKFISHRWMHLFEWKSACIELALEPFQFRFSYTFDWTKLICSPFRSRISFSPAPPLSPLPWSMSRHTQEIHSNWFHMKKFIVKNRENEFISVIWFGWHDSTTFSRLQVIVSLENTYWIDDVYAAWSAGRNVF